MAGGVTMPTRQPIAIGPTGHIDGWIKPGVRTLSGPRLLWYARSRATSDDYSRMARQKCVMNAMLQMGNARIVANGPRSHIFERELRQALIRDDIHSRLD